MDSIFLLEDGDRASFLDQMMQAFGCVHVCLWYYMPQSNCLVSLDGLYQERRSSNQQSTSYGSLAMRLFDVYRESSNYPHNGRIPGIAFASNNPYMKLELHDFQSRVSTDFQQQFYQEAGIKTIVLMGCSTGEIEIGMSSEDHLQVDIEMEMKNLIRHRFPHHADPNQPPSSSSSSLRSLSVDSPEYPPLLFNSNIPTASSSTPAAFLPQPPKETPIGQEAFRSSAAAPPPTTTTTTPLDQATQALNQIRNVQFPSIESEEAEMTRAILAVLSSPSTSSSPQPNLPPIDRQSRNVIPTAFRRYRANSEPRIAGAAQKNSKFKRAVLFFRNLNLSRQEFEVQGNRPTATQMHHMISERRRREKLNESFHILRSLLPPGSKKDKASVLSSTTEYLSSLKSRVEELTKLNQMLSLQLNSIKKTEEFEVSADQAGERVSVGIAQVSSSSSSSSETRFLDLRVTVRGGISMLDLLIRVIEFLKGQTNVSLSSVESNTRMLGSVAVHAVIMRLRVDQGDEFDESGFREAVRRVVDDQASKLTS